LGDPKAKGAAAPAKRKRRTPADISARIISAAGDEFRRFGYAGATTAGIAKAAEVTEAQIFRYFESKANLFREAVFKPLDEQFKEFIDEHINDFDVGAVQEGTATYIDRLQQFFSEQGSLLIALFVARNYDPSVAVGVSTISSLAKYFDRGAEQVTARLSAPPQIDPKIMVRVSFAAVLGCVLFKEWIFPPGLASDDEIMQAINDFTREGIEANLSMGPLPSGGLKRK
jgi:AcrR family transcriptional regulator